MSLIAPPKLRGVVYPQWPAALDSAASGLVARYDFASESGLTLSGPEITAVTDLSGNGHDLAPPTPGERPLYSTKVLNGLGGAIFSSPSGTAELKAASAGLTGEFTYAFVVSGTTDIAGIFDGNPGATKGLRFFDNAGTPEIDFMTGGLTRQVLYGDAGSTNLIVTIAVSGGTVTGTAYKSGVSSANDAASTADSPTLGAFALGAINGGTTYFYYIHEVAIWQGVFSSGERSTWDSYSLSKWGV